jgi:hypothetical protein
MSWQRGWVRRGWIAGAVSRTCSSGEHHVWRQLWSCLFGAAGGAVHGGEGRSCAGAPAGWAILPTNGCRASHPYVISTSLIGPGRPRGPIPGGRRPHSARV